ncbi:hypothetical protein GCM10017567_17740 [Amycolatopsis bullii]|uniref:Uncharacterized protein n=1 Tax=Amycolatopsis bullii TaxID=941987 RepID=A0ABQ3K6X9_9PSEU|nr:hypothetical protein GCM10017567_17740 [Amycolatopsis bullii]
MTLVALCPHRAGFRAVVRGRCCIRLRRVLARPRQAGDSALFARHTRALERIAALARPEGT